MYPLKNNMVMKQCTVAIATVIVSIMVSFSTYAKNDQWKFIINTPDGTPDTGSVENTVGFDDFGFFSTPAILGNRIDSALEKYKNHEDYWKEEKPEHNNVITKNGSLHVDVGLDLYVYDGVAYNGKTGAAYSKGHYFTVTWENIKVGEIDFSGVSEMDPLSYVDNFSFDSNEGMRGTSASFYRLMVVFAGAGMVFSIIFAGLKLAFRGAKALKDGLLETLGYKIIVFMVLCAFVGLFGLFGELIKALVHV